MPDESGRHLRRISKNPNFFNRLSGISQDGHPKSPTAIALGSFDFGLQDAVPTTPNIASQALHFSLEYQVLRQNSSSSEDSSNSIGGCDRWRSRHSTDTTRPLVQARVSGSARAAACKEQVQNGAQNAALDKIYLSSSSDSRSSSSTSSLRQPSASSDTSSDLPLYIPHRRRSLLETPGVARRPEKPKIINNTEPPHRPELRSFQPYRPQQAPGGESRGSLDIATGKQTHERLHTPPETAYKQLGSIEFGSLRITNGSPLSMRRGQVNSLAALDILNSTKATSKLSTVTSTPRTPTYVDTKSLRIVSPDEPAFDACPGPSVHDPVPEPEGDQPDNFQRGKEATSRGSKMESMSARNSRFPSVIDDDQLKLVRRQTSKRVTGDDGSSIYSIPDSGLASANTPSDDALKHQSANTDSGYGSNFSFFSLRNLVRQSRKSTVDSPTTATAATNNFSHKRSASEGTAASQPQTPSRRRRKLKKQSKKSISTPQHQQLPQPPSSIPQVPSRSQTLYDSVGREKPASSIQRSMSEKRHQGRGRFWSKSEGGIPRMSQFDERTAIPPVPRQMQRSFKDHTNRHPTGAEPVSILSDRTRRTPRTHVSFDNLPDEAMYERPVAGQQLRRRQTFDSKPLPIPQPEMPRRRTPVRVDPPMRAVFDPRVTYPGQMQPRNREDTEPPMKGRPSTMASNGESLRRNENYSSYNTEPRRRDVYEHRQEVEKRRREEDRRQEGEDRRQHSPDSPYVSPLSDDDPDLFPWPFPPTRKTEPVAEVSPAREPVSLRHSKSMPSIRNGDDRQLRTPAPISVHSRRAHEAAARNMVMSTMPQQAPPPPPIPALPLMYPPQPAPQPAPVVPSRELALEGWPEPPSFESNDRDGDLPPIVYRNGTRRGSEVSSAVWRPPYRILHSYYSPAYRNAPIWG